MAIYVGIRKVASDDDFAEYSFGPNENEVGKLRIYKSSGKVEILDEVPGDESGKYSMRAARKLMLHFRKQEFPDETCFAS